MMRPFIIYALPRSRTAWLSAFLTYREWRCYHEQAIYMRSMEDVRALFSVPNRGCAETAAIQGRPLIRHAIPGIREVVVLRPVDEVIESVMRLDLGGSIRYDRDVLRRNMEYGDRQLRKAAKEPGVLAVDYADLQKEETCAAIFEHCLPYRFDANWWDEMKNRNIQADAREVIRYYHQHRGAVDQFKRYCKTELRRLYRLGAFSTRAEA